MSLALKTFPSGARVVFSAFNDRCFSTHSLLFKINPTPRRNSSLDVSFVTTLYVSKVITLMRVRATAAQAFLSNRHINTFVSRPVIVNSFSSLFHLCEMG